MESTQATTKEKAPRPKQRITVRALLEAKRLSDAKLHPDGRHVAFVVTEADFDDSRWVSHLWLTEWVTPEDAADHDESDKDGEAATDGDDEEDDRTRQLT